MFTTLDFAAAKNRITQKRGNQVYTPQMSEVSFGLSELTPTDRGTCVELMIVDRMLAHGVETTHVGGSNAGCDLTLYVGGKIVRGEVKSSVLGPKSGKYYFQGVKPECFDILFFAFVHPSMGLVVKTAGVKSILNWIREYSPVRKDEGYDIYFRGDMSNDKIPTIEWDPSGWGAKM